MNRTTCKDCVFLVEERCELGKHKILNALKNDDTKEIKLFDQCAFKQHTQFPLSNDRFTIAHKAAKANFAVSIFFICHNEADTEEVFRAMPLVPRDSVVCNVSLVIAYPIEKAKYVATVQRFMGLTSPLFWKCHVVEEEGMIEVQGLRSICFTSMSPYVYQVEGDMKVNEALIRNFEYHCYSRPLPPEYTVDGINFIKNLRYVEHLENKRVESEIQG